MKSPKSNYGASRKSAAVMILTPMIVILAMQCPISLAQQVGDQVYPPLPFGKNDYSMAHTIWPPTPFLLSTNYPVYFLGTIDGQPGYAYDDRELGMMSFAASDADGLLPPGFDDSGTNSYTEPEVTPLVFGTN